MVTNKGEIIYSKVVAVNLNNKSAIIVFYPNPVKASASVSIAALKRETLRWNVTDLAGRALLQGEINTSVGNNQLNIDTDNLVSGAYILLLKGPETTKMFKFTKE